MWRTRDAREWTEATSLGDDDSEPMDVEELWFNVQQGELVAGGDGHGWTSSDGVTWQVVMWRLPYDEERHTTPRFTSG